MNVENITKGMVVHHSLGIPMSVITVIEKERSNKEKFHMVKCRYVDKQGLFHVHEFFMEELWLNGIKLTHHI